MDRVASMGMWIIATIRTMGITVRSRIVETTPSITSMATKDGMGRDTLEIRDMMAGASTSPVDICRVADLAAAASTAVAVVGITKTLV